MWEENVVTAPNDGNAQNVAQPKLRSATLREALFNFFFFFFFFFFGGGGGGEGVGESVVFKILNKQENHFSMKYILSYDVAVIQWITSCHNTLARTRNVTDNAHVNNAFSY